MPPQSIVCLVAFGRFRGNCHPSGRKAAGCISDLRMISRLTPSAKSQVRDRRCPPRQPWRMWGFLMHFLHGQIIGYIDYYIPRWSMTSWMTPYLKSQSNRLSLCDVPVPRELYPVNFLSLSRVCWFSENCTTPARSRGWEFRGTFFNLHRKNS